MFKQKFKDSETGKQFKNENNILLRKLTQGKSKVLNCKNSHLTNRYCSIFPNNF